MKIFIASHSSESANALAGALLVATRHSISPAEIVSTWHRKEAGGLPPTESYSRTDREQIAIADLADVERADVLVLIAGPDKYSGGKFVEAGFALGLNKRVFILGRPENMILWHPRVHACRSTQYLVAALRNIAIDYKRLPPSMGKVLYPVKDIHDHPAVAAPEAISDEGFNDLLRAPRTTTGGTYPPWETIRAEWKGGPA